MKPNVCRYTPPLLGILASALGFAWSYATPPLDGIDLRLPKTPAVATSAPKPAIDAGPEFGRLLTGPGTPGTTTGSWTGFRGAGRDGIAHDSPALARTWPPEGPPLLWRIPVGEGYAGPAIQDGRVYLLDYDVEKRHDALRCLSLEDGREIWRYTYPLPLKRNHGYSRTVPALDGNRVVSFGPKCHILCLDATTGEKKWDIDLVGDYGARAPQWYAGQCPLIEEGRVILAVGAAPLAMAVDIETGETAWTTPNPGDWSMTHASVIPMTIAGQRQFVGSFDRGLAGIDAESGKLLWTYTGWRLHTIVPTPVPLSDDRLFLTAGYNKGSEIIRIVRHNDGFRAESVKTLSPRVFAAEQQTPVFFNNNFFGVSYGTRPAGQFVCLSPDGDIRWTSGAQHTFGLGPFLAADGLLFVLDDHGTLTLSEATANAFRPLARATVLEGHDCWGPMALVDGRLFVRSLTELICLDVREARP